MAKLGKRQLLNAQGGRRVPAATVWTPVTQGFFQTCLSVDCQGRAGPTSLPSDRRETEARGVTSKRLRRGIPEPAPHSRDRQPAGPHPRPSAPGTAPRLGSGGSPVPAAVGADRVRWESEGPARVSGPRPRTCRSRGSRQSPASGPLANARPRHQRERPAGKRGCDPEPHSRQSRK